MRNLPIRRLFKCPKPISASIATACLLAATPSFAAEQTGRVVSAGASVNGARVSLYQAGDGISGPVLLGRDRTNTAGAFAINHSAPDGALLYVIADGGATAFGVRGKPRGPIRFATVLGTDGGPGPVTINEYTTLATGYSFNQFLKGRRISGVAPGPKNAFAMMGNMVDIETGDMGEVLATAPNGSETQTMGEFNSLANLLATCARATRSAPCNRLFKLATPPGGKTPRNTLQAVLNIARNPGHKHGKLFRLSKRIDFYQPTMEAAPETWTLALRFVGNGMEIDGPGNFAFDADGNAWVVNNYVYTESPFDTACGGQQLLRFDPSGKDYPGAPYEGGGLYGAGYGVIIDKDSNVWASNFGFQGTGCEQKQRDKSLSKFSPDGEALSPNWKGFTQGDILRPQGMASDGDGNIWTASCGNDSLVIYPGGDPTLAENFANTGVKKPFDVATDSDGNVWAAGNRNNRIVKLDPDGNVLFLSKRRAGGLKHPMGVTADEDGNVWVANSGAVVAPCYFGESLNPPNKADASVVMFGPDGEAKGSFTGGGEILPWGISLDGDNNVWVSNFAGQRLSHFCGPNPETCPSGKTTGDPISPKSGYAFDGLTRNTAAQVDPSGNVWVTNNWLPIPFQTNPGGKQIVVFVGLGAPTAGPVVGPPSRP